jgi:hypothetical protein
MKSRRAGSKYLPVLRMLYLRFFSLSQAPPRVSHFGHRKRGVPLLRSAFRAKCALSLNPTGAPTPHTDSHLNGPKPQDTRLRSPYDQYQNEVHSKTDRDSRAKEGAQLSKGRSPTSLADRPRTPSIPLRKSEVPAQPRCRRAKIPPNRPSAGKPVRNHQREAPRTNARSLARSFGHRILGADRVTPPPRPVSAGVLQE